MTARGEARENAAMNRRLKLQAVVPGGISGESKKGGDSTEGGHHPTPQNSLHHLQCSSSHLHSTACLAKQAAVGIHGFISMCGLRCA